MATRKYSLRERARRQEATRLRIVEAAVALHREVGPARTQLSEVAERAGVDRVTVYRHFADPEQLLSACAQHFLAGNPPPDVAGWAAVGGPSRRLRQGLEELYRYYEANAQMIASVLRDAAVLPVGRGFLNLQEQAAAALAATRPRSARHRTLVSLATAFSTWQVLGAQAGLDAARAAALMAAAIEGAG